MSLQTSRYQNVQIEYVLRTTEKELHVLWSEGLHSLVVGIDGRVNHVGLLLLNQHHSAFDRIFDAKTGDCAGSSLSDTMASIGGLPFRSWVPPSKSVSQGHKKELVNLRVNDEDSRGFSQVQRYTTSLERNEKAFNIHVVHEMLNRSLSLSGSHAAIKHHCGDTSSTETPLNELQHGGELRKDD